MSTKRSGQQLVALGALMAGCFFLPWCELSCSGTPLFVQSGAQIAAGELETIPNAQEKIQATIQDQLGGSVQFHPPDLSALPPVGAAPWVWAFLVGGLLAIAGGSLLLAKRGGFGGVRLALVGGGLGVLVVLAALTFNFPLHHESKEPGKNPFLPVPGSPPPAPGVPNIGDLVFVKKSYGFYLGFLAAAGCIFVASAALPSDPNASPNPKPDTPPEPQPKP